MDGKLIKHVNIADLCLNRWLSDYMGFECVSKFWKFARELAEYRKTAQIRVFHILVTPENYHKIQFCSEMNTWQSID